MIYVGPLVSNEEPFPFPEFVGDPAAIDRRLRGYVKRIVTSKVKEIGIALAWTQDNIIPLDNAIIRTFCTTEQYRPYMRGIRLRSSVNC